MSVEVFYPINTPLINYFFYKAPFVSSSFVLTTLTVQNGGSGYSVGDIIVTAGGTFTSPVTLKVTTVSSGAVTGVTITNNGKYTVTPTTFTQAYSSGSGTGATFNNLSFVADILPPGPNIPLAGGFIYFYADEDHTLELPTYSDVSDPQNPVVNTNPIQLGAAGDCPLFYLEDRFYYIVITDYTGDQANPITTINHYNPKSALIGGAYNNNFIVNPQFNYPIVFYKTTDEVGEITKPVTLVAWGCEFLEDDETETKNYVTFENIEGQGIEGDPINQIVLNSNLVSAEESKKDFRWRLGQADFNEGNQLTFCVQMINKLTGTINVDLILQIFYGEGGSDPQEISLTSFNVTVTRQKFIETFTMPSISGKTVGAGNRSSIILRPGIGQICQVGITNVMTVPGNVPAPIFVTEPTGFSKAQILGVSTDIEHAGLDENYSSYYYTDGLIFPYADTGTIVLEPNTTIQEFREKCDGSSRKISDYSVNDIPYRRLYNVIGNTFGSGGSLIATSNGDVVTVSSVEGARQKTAWANGDTTFTFTDTVIGLRYSLSLSRTSNPMVLSGEFYDKFAPDQTANTYSSAATILPFGPNQANNLLNYWGTRNGEIPTSNITIVTTDPGSPTVNATFTIQFNETNPTLYKTRIVNVTGGAFPVPTISSFIEFSSFANNNRRPNGVNSNNEQILFALDEVGPPGFPGVVNDYAIQPINYLGAIPFRSNLSIQKNILIFKDFISNPFTVTIQVTSVPTAGQYFLYSSATVDYYGWFTVNGVGVDPAVPGRTGVEIPLFTGYTEEQTAIAIADAINDAEFSLPSEADLPALVVDSKVSWFINL